MKNDCKKVVIEPDAAFVEKCHEEALSCHLVKYANDIISYRRHLAINLNNSDDIIFYTICTKETDQYEIINMLSKSLGSPGIEEIYNSISFCDNVTGDECYYTWEPIYLACDLINSKGETWLEIWYKVLITDEIEEFIVGVTDQVEISLLQHAFDQQGSNTCILPSKRCIQQWQSEIATIFQNQEHRYYKTVDAFIALIDKKDGNELINVYKNIPKLQNGNTLFQLCISWLRLDQVSLDLELALWILQGNSYNLHQKLLKPESIYLKKLEESFDDLISVTETPLRGKLGWPIPRGSYFRKYKGAILEELQWYINS